MRPLRHAQSLLGVSNDCSRTGSPVGHGGHSGHVPRLRGKRGAASGPTCCGSSNALGIKGPRTAVLADPSGVPWRRWEALSSSLGRGLSAPATPENHLVTQQEGSWPCGLWPRAAPALRASPTAGLHPFVRWEPTTGRPPGCEGHSGGKTLVLCCPPGAQGPGRRPCRTHDHTDNVA